MAVEITLHLWSLSASENAIARLTQHLNEEEISRANRFVYDKHRKAYVAGRGRLREILGDVVGQSPADVTFEYGPQGKPNLAVGPRFNLSHSGGVACLALHAELPLGVDIEVYRPVEDGVAQRFFSPLENKALTAMPHVQQQAGFFRCWTRKEAIVKALGGGLSIPLDAFDVTLSPNAPRLTRLDPEFGAATEWSLAHIDMGENMVGAVAAQTNGAPITLRISGTPDDAV